MCLEAKKRKAKNDYFFFEDKLEKAIYAQLL